MNNQLDALDMLHLGTATALRVGGLVIYIEHALSANEVLAVATNCIALVWCGSGQDHVARVSGHVCREVVFRTCVVHIMTMFVRTIA